MSSLPQHDPYRKGLNAVHMQNVRLYPSRYPDDIPVEGKQVEAETYTVAARTRLLQPVNIPQFTRTKGGQRILRYTIPARDVNRVPCTFERVDLFLKPCIRGGERRR